MHRIFVIMTILLTMLAWLPASPAFAASPGIDIDNCAPGLPSWQYTNKVVTCVERSIRDAVIAVMAPISAYMTPVAAAMTVFAVAIWGIRMMGGEADPRGRLLGFCIRLGFMYYFFDNLTTYASLAFDVEAELVALVSGGSPWVNIDQIFGRLIGTGPPADGLDISKGLLGILGVSLLSNTAANILGFIAISAFINFLLFIFRIVFTYLTAITVIGFLMIISPIALPMVLFVQHTERFFTKWLDILISAMLVPMLLFAFLNVFFTGFQALIDDVFRILCGSASGGTDCVSDPSSTDFSAFQKMNRPIFSWTIPTDPNLANKLTTVTASQDVGKPAVQSFMVPMQRRAHDTAFMPTPSLDFGPSAVQIMQELIYAFAALWIFASFMKSLVDKIPDLAYNIADATSHISMAPTVLERNIGKGLRDVQTAITGYR